MQTALSHIQFNVRPENLAFYVDLFAQLGWKTVYADDSMFGVGDSNRTSLWFIGHVKDVENDYDGPGINHLAISPTTQTDVDTIAAYLTDRGVEFF